VDGLSTFLKFVILERVEEITDTPPFVKFGNPAYGQRYLEEVERVNRGDFWQNLIFAAETVRLARLEPVVPYVCRGSAGSSLLCYLVGITNIDPVRAGISLSRFLGGGRDKPPDIDLDFPSELRPEIWQRLRARFGDRLGFVATKLKYRERGALREALRRSGIPFDFWLSSSAVISEEQKQRVMSLAASLEGKTYGLSRHCGGIVFFPKGIPRKFLSARPRQPLSQLILDKQELEQTGFGKLDVLSNFGLSHLRYTGLEDHLGGVGDCSSQGSSCHSNDPEPQREHEVGRLFATGNSWGILQAESPAMRKLLVTLGVSSLEALTLALGLIRPAVSSSSKPSSMGRNPLERMLVYEDDVAEFLSVILGSGMSLGEYSRRILSKGGKEAKKLLKDVGRIVNKKGKDRILFRGKYWTWTEIKRQLGLASAYSFCKSHAVAYARVAWLLAEAKARDPRLFWQGFLNTSVSSSMYMPWVYFERIKRELGVSVLWPGDFNLPVGKFFKVPWVIEDNKVYPLPSTQLSLGIVSASSFDKPTLERQFLAAGFWAGGLELKDGSPLAKTYFYPFVGKDGFYDFCGLRALKNPRIHPLDSESVCFFQTLGVGSSKILETSLVYSRQSLFLQKLLMDPSVYYSSRGLLCSQFHGAGSTYYLRC